MRKDMTKQEFLRQMASEQRFYDHSLRARILRHDGYMLSRYLYHLRMVEWHEITPPIYGTSAWRHGINTGCGTMAA